MSLTAATASNLRSAGRRPVKMGVRRRSRGPRTSVDRVVKDEATAVLPIGYDDRAVRGRRELLKHLVLKTRNLRAEL